MRWLLEHGARIDVVDDQGRTPLHVACERNTSTGVVEILVKHGAEIQAIDANGETPMTTALRNSRSKVVQYLNSISSAQPGSTTDALTDAGDL